MGSKGHRFSDRLVAIRGSFGSTFDHALLGACAYLARRYEGEGRLKARRFAGAESPWVRIIIAIIGGLVVGPEKPDLSATRLAR